MKKSILFFALFLSSMTIVLYSCGSKKYVADPDYIPYKVAYGYIAKTDSCMNCKSIKSEKEFKKYFAEIFTQDESAKPTQIDFSKEFVIATVFPATNEKFDIGPSIIKFLPNKDSLLVSYSHMDYSTKRTSIHRPTLLYILDRKYIDYGYKFGMVGRSYTGSPSLTPYLIERNRLLIE